MKKNKETRIYEMRADVEPDSRKVVGYAAVYERDSEDFGFFVERIAPGAFDEAIATSDVRALINHDPNLILGRTPNTLTVSTDERGLRYEFEVPDTSYGNDFLVSLRRGDITQSSFGFTIEEDEWEKKDGKTIRTITKVKRLYDVSPVTYPAYPDTSVATRSLEMFEARSTYTDEIKNDHYITSLALQHNSSKL